MYKAWKEGRCAVVQSRVLGEVSREKLQNPVTWIIKAVRQSVHLMVARTVEESPQPYPRGP